MNKVIASIALIFGILFLLVPRYILPACEFEGYARMHCSDTALAEQVVGAILMLVGVVTFFSAASLAPITGAVLSSILFLLAFWLPGHFGYCQSPRMPCNYGMVPAIRFLSVGGLLIMTGAVVSIVRSYRKKGRL